MKYKVAVIGYGYWGPNIVRNFNNHPHCSVKYICDLNEKARDRAANDFTQAKIIDNSFIRAIFRSLCVFSITFAASAIFMLLTLNVPASIIEE